MNIQYPNGQAGAAIPGKSTPTVKHPSFYQRANAHIDLSNDQLKHGRDGEISASMMYGTARFNTSLTARGYDSGAQMAANRSKDIEYFVDEYRLMLAEHMDEYIANFERYMQMARQAIDLDQRRT